jgi:hypothetical protein
MVLVINNLRNPPAGSLVLSPRELAVGYADLCCFVRSGCVSSVFVPEAPPLNGGGDHGSSKWCTVARPVRLLFAATFLVTLSKEHRQSLSETRVYYTSFSPDYAPQSGLFFFGPGTYTFVEGGSAKCGSLVVAACVSGESMVSSFFGVPRARRYSSDPVVLAVKAFLDGVGVESHTDSENAFPFLPADCSSCPCGRRVCVDDREP